MKTNENENNLIEKKYSIVDSDGSVFGYDMTLIQVESSMSFYGKKIIKEFELEIIEQEI